MSQPGAVAFQDQVLAALHDVTCATATELGEMLGSTYPATVRHLVSMSRQGTVERFTMGRSVVWRPAQRRDDLSDLERLAR